MNLPGDLVHELSGELGALTGASPVTGGCVSSAARIEARGETYFLKFERDARARFFAAEAAGLQRLRSAATRLRIPAVVHVRDRMDGWSWIVLEWLEPGGPAPAAWRDLGMGLAELHRSTSDRCGSEEDGYIGRLPQSNARESTWSTFWRERRLRPQLELARATPGIGSDAEWERLFDALPRLLAEGDREPLSLLHGDLWSGNVLFTSDAPAIVDPASYFGHREVDLAMARLFGGFARDFYDAYEDVCPPAPGEEVRRSLYQLYYLLVHVNLFGVSYAPQTRRALHAALAASGSGS